jgi:hypothetical protein
VAEDSVGLVDGHTTLSVGLVMAISCELSIAWELGAGVIGTITLDEVTTHMTSFVYLL